MAGRREKKTSIVQTAGGDPLRFQLWNQPLCSSLVVQLHLRPKAVLKRRRGEGGVAGGWLGRGGGYVTGAARCSGSTASLVYSQ